MVGWESLKDIICSAAGTTKGITFISADDDERFVSYHEIYSQALIMLGSFQSRGIKPGDEILFQIDDNEKFIVVFWACILGRIIPVPVSVGNNEEHKVKIFRIWNILNHPYLVTDREKHARLTEFMEKSDSDFCKGINDRVVFLEEAQQRKEIGLIQQASGDDIAFIQFSSGSTGDPKGVMLTHGNLLANITAMIEGAHFVAEDVIINWMPLTHDMGLVGTHLATLGAGMNQVMIPTALFIRRPVLWLKKANEHKATILASPNFGYRYFLSHYKPEVYRDWDLSRIRVIFNGAEPIAVDLCHEFLNTLAPCGLRKNIMFTCFGMAEACLAVTFPVFGQEMSSVTVSRESLGLGKLVASCVEEDKDHIKLAVLGRPVLGCDVRICDDKDRPLGEMTVGNVQIKGLNVTQGYYNNPAATKAAITKDGWLRTGDLGFMSKEGLVITGRAKDIIFVNGQNFYPQDIEKVAQGVGGIKLNEVVAVSAPGSQDGTEDIILFVYYKKKLEKFLDLAADLRLHINRQMGLVIKEVVPVKSIPKTTSGKLQRYKLAMRYGRGDYADELRKLDLLKKNKPHATGISSTKVVENQIIELWKQILHTTEIDVNDTFLDLGGNSLLAIQMHEKLDELFPGKVKVTDLYTYQSIAQLAEYITRDETQDKAVGLPVNVQPEENEIAVIGVACRFPEANNINEFWENLKSGKNSVREVSRWDLADFYDPNPRMPGKSYCKWGGLLEEIDTFDPLFFNISPTEAELMDPQQRVFLEEAWKALEDAGYSDRALDGKNCGVFVGCTNGDYASTIRKIGVQPDAYVMTGTNESILASRIAYHLNLKGPAVAVGTACSASLVALHLACETLRNQQCEMALAGGVNILTTPEFYISASKAGMLSASGLCRTFDQAADGMVPAEGAGVVVLKRLSAAVRDGDNIYAVIKGSGINQDGKTSGITAPCVASQAELERKVYDKYNINPELIGYVEAHGSATKLGDPIEVEALNSSFRAYTDKKGYCALGSVKTNIGHTLAAAGIAGLIKVLLCLRHKRLVPSLNFANPNEYLKLNESPFYVVTENTSWGKNAGNPRLAAVSSFGFSGTNAHVVVEEFASSESVARIPDRPFYPVAISAKSDAALTQKMIDLSDWLKREENPVNMEDLSFTLFFGRSQFSKRCAFIVKDVEDLKTALLTAICQPAGEHFVKSEANNKKTGLERALRQFGQQQIEELTSYPSLPAELYKEKLEALMELWAGGYDLPWKKLFSAGQHKRISLPTYPFAKERYWVKTPSGAKELMGSQLHPLLDRIDPARSMEHQGLVFVKHFRPCQTILKDHQVGGAALLAGAAQLEMAYAGAREIKGKLMLVLKDILWRQPVVCTEPGTDVLAAFKEHDGKLRFQIQSLVSGKSVIYSQGEIITEFPPEAEQSLQLEDIKARCASEFNADDIYRKFQEAGIMYGPYFQGLQKIWASPTEALGLITIPDRFAGELTRFSLHPGLLDAALQSIMGTILQQEGQIKQYLPFSVREVLLHSELPAKGYSYVVSNGSGTFNIWITNEEGILCAELKQLCLREAKDSLQQFFYTPVWKRVFHDEGRDILEEQTDAEGDSIVVVGSGDLSGCLKELQQIHEPRLLNIISLGSQSIVRQLSDVSNINTVYYLGGFHTKAVNLGDLEQLNETQEQGVFSFFRLIKALEQLGCSEKDLTIKVLTNNIYKVTSGDSVCPYSASLVGLVKSAAKEYTHWKFCCIDVESDQDTKEPEAGWAQVARVLVRERGRRYGEEIVYRKGKCYQRILEPVYLPPSGKSLFVDNGVYLILGGAGGIGLELSRFLAKTVKARLVLIGRSPLDERKLSKITEIEALGGRVLYLQADAADLDSMVDAVRIAKEKFGSIQGAIHSAIVLKDAMLKDMDEHSLRAVLEPKVAGSVILWRVLKDEPLDFLMFFSSAQSFIGNSGQGNYTAACAFKDAFAAAIESGLSCPVKIINWGYWGSVGIVADSKYNRLLAAQGIHSIEPVEGIEAVQRILKFPLPQVLPFKAERRVLDALKIDNNTQVHLVSGVIPSLVASVVTSLNGLDAFTGFMEESRQAFTELKKFSRQMVACVFRQLSLSKEATEVIDRETFIAEAGIQPGYKRLFNALLDMMVSAGYLVKQDSGSLVTTPLLKSVERERLPQSVTLLSKDYPEIAAHIRLIWACFQQYVEILTGQVPATNVIFPRSSMELVEGIYKGNPIADGYNRLASASIKKYLEMRIETLRPGEKINILEVGAGTGGTSAPVLAEIAEFGNALNYVYSDVSAGFIQYGKKNYGNQYPFLEFRIIDLEQELSKQGVRSGTYDIVLAANVLHATKNLRQTLRNLKTLLKTNGFLLLNELTEVLDFTTLTFGLLDGWWCFEDPEIRLKGSPLLSDELWHELLLEEGFRDIRILGTSADGGTGMGQSIILAESDGLVRILNKNDVEPQGHELEAAFESRTRKALAAVKQSHSANVQFSEPVKTSGEVKEYIKEVILQNLSEVLQINKGEFDHQAPFNEFGVDSILAVEIVERVNEQLRIGLRTTELFNYSTIKELTGHIFAEFGKTIRAANSAAGDQVDNNLVRDVAVSEDQELAGLRSETAPLSEECVGTGNVGMGIAVIGMAGKFPGADNLEKYWENLSHGCNTVSEISRWKLKDFYDADPAVPNKTYCKYGGFLSDIDIFDPYFFGITPKEAELMDPQQRLFLQEAWLALEDAGYPAQRLEGKKCGVFVGCASGDYLAYLREAKVPQDALSFTGNSGSILAARISYLLNLKGPSIAIDTACSSSLVAVHMACESILSGTSEMALAGGVAVLATPGFHIMASKAGMLSPDGQCRAFDQEANGFVPGEGVGVVVLKRLEAAIRDGDNIYGIIQGSGLNQDGRTNGITAPSTISQTALECEVYHKYHINPEHISYVEAHGTGTRLGDPIEIDALTEAFQKYTRRKQFCPIGSVKTNIGHALTASGAASLIKVMLCLKHKKLVPSLNLNKENELINFRETPFYVNTKLRDWESCSAVPRTAAISSFGFSGTNAHLVVREYGPQARERKNNGDRQIIALSAKSEQALRHKAEDLVNWLSRQEALEFFGDISYTLLTGRVHFPVRTAFIAGDRVELLKGLAAISEGVTEHPVNQVERDFKPEPDSIKAGAELLRQLRDVGLPEPTRKKCLLAVADLYMAGYDLDWQEMYQGDYKKASLPGYPFSGESFWVQAPNKEASLRLFGKRWNKQNTEVDFKKELPFTGSIVLLVDEETEIIGSQLFTESNRSQKILLNLREIEDHEQGATRARELLTQEGHVSLLLDLTGLSSGWERKGLLPKIGMLQEFIKNHDQKEGLFLLQLTKGLQTMTGVNGNYSTRQLIEMTLRGADTAGLMKMLQAEYHRVIARTVDIDIPPEDIWGLENIVCAELSLGDSFGESFWHSGYRYVPSLIELEPTVAQDAIKPGEIDIRNDKVIVITGGTRGLGALIAEDLVKRGARKLALMGYNRLTEEKLAYINRLEQMGATVQVYSGALDQREKISRFFTKVREMGQIEGVIHCAGFSSTENPAFVYKDTDEILKTIQPKIDGLLTLHEELHRDGLKYFILFSSISAVVPSLAAGASIYAAANSYMDYFAGYQQRLGNKYYKSINWPAWKGVGMGEVKTPAYLHMGMGTIDSEEGLGILYQVMGNDGEFSIVPLKVEGEKFQPAKLLDVTWRPTQLPPTEQSSFGKKVGSGSLPGTLDWVCDLFAKELKIPQEKLDIDAPFGEMGVDSILLTDLLKKCESKVGQKLDPMAFFEYPTLRTFSSYLEQTGVGPIESVGPTDKTALWNINSLSPRNKENEIAVIGLACHFPEAVDKEAYWHNLLKGKDCITLVPPERWSIQDYYSPHYERGKSISKWGGFIEGIEQFDPDYFKMAHDVAAHTDPLVRQFLESSVQVFRDAGYSQEEIDGKKIGVFVGARAGGFSAGISAPLPNTITGTGQNFIAAHVSHFFNIKGPNLVVDTACSSSLVAIHLACQSLLLEESEMALAGGVDILLDEKPYLVLSEGRALSPDGKCYTFDERANGFVPGEGCGTVLLKPLSRALADGDNIYGVIEASAVNNDGHTMGITTPNPEAQKAVILEAFNKAGVSPSTSTYIETHGTGTMIGDPIELKALTEVFRNWTDETQYCGVGSVKTNIGHLMSAAGVASFIKTMLSLYYKQLPPTLNCDNPNPRFKFSASPFYINDHLGEWLPRQGVRRAGISSFGFGGTNAHIIVRDLDDVRRLQRPVVRQPLPPVQLNRRRFWPTEAKRIQTNIEGEPRNRANEDGFAELLRLERKY